MRTQNILLVLLFASLYGCQPEAPTPKAAVQPSVVPAPAEQAVRPAVSEAAVAAPIQQTQPAAKEKIAAAEKGEVSQPAAAEKPAQSALVQAVDAPVAKVEPAPSAVEEIKPEAPPESAVSEADAMQLAKKNNCFSCHAAGKKVVGPSFKDVAAKYRGDTGAEARLMDKIAKGGSGVWGVMVMPPSPKISEADRRVLARLVLSSNKLSTP